MTPGAANRLMAAIGQIVYEEWPLLEADSTCRHVAASLSELLHAHLADDPDQQADLLVRLRALADRSD
jgi:hypothetical protein